jgi:hypothetical protein
VCRIGREPHTQRGDIGYLVGGEGLAEHGGQFRLASPLVCQAQQLDSLRACHARRGMLAQSFERLPVGITREELIPVHQVH